MKELTTEVYGLRFSLKGNRLCFIVEDPPGYVNKKVYRHWVDLKGSAAKHISKVVGDHIEAEEADARLTPAELAEKYKETMGS